jgi:hypothetical protein
MDKKVRLLGLGTVVLTALAVTAGAVALRDDPIDPAADRAALMKHHSGGSYARGFEHLVEMLPNAAHGPDGGRVTDSVVVGTITDVAEHTGVVDVMPDETLGTPDRNDKVPFDSPTAHWRNLKLTVTVTDVLAGSR